MGSSCTLSYDTATPYEGANSLVISATTTNSGISSLKSYPVAPGQIYRLQAALQLVSGAFGAAAVAQLNFYDVRGGIIDGSNNPLSNNGINYAPFIESTATGMWQLKAVQGTVPAGAATMQVQLYMAFGSGTAVGEFDAISATLISSAIPYYLKLITSEYQNAPNFLALLGVLLQPFVDVGICAASISSAFDLVNGAEGAQLDVLGVILGASRTLPFTPTVSFSTTTSAPITFSSTFQWVPVASLAGMSVGASALVDTGGNQETVIINGYGHGDYVRAIFTKNHSSGVAFVAASAPSALLDDAHYRILLQAKVLFNQFNGFYQGPNSVLWAAWQQLFPGGSIYITDNQNMTATIFLTGAFDPLVQQMITNGLIIPRTQGVKFIYVFGTLPLFGFDNFNPAFIAGWDTGHWG